MTENEAKDILEELQIEVKRLEDSMYEYNTYYLNALDIASKVLEEIQQYRAIGTVEEIKKVVRFLSMDNDNGIIEDLQLLNQYQLIGTVEECREARERQRAKKPIEYEDRYYGCPTCGNSLMYKWEKYPTVLNDRSNGLPYCLSCGQKLDWSE